MFQEGTVNWEECVSQEKESSRITGGDGATSTRNCDCCQEGHHDSFMNIAFPEAALAHRGWNPYNRAPLNDLHILITVTEQVQKEQDAVLCSHMIDTSIAVPVSPSQRDLLTTGS